MGYCYYGNYASYFEVARVEALREMGISYKALEEQGILLPVLTFEIKYHIPALYDDLLTIETQLTQLEGARIAFAYRIYNEAKQLLNEASTTLVFVNANTSRPMAIPATLYEHIQQFYA
ncbi:MAG: putative acyl-CoA thioesterase YneP [Bacteroidota bacterium]